MMTSKLGNAQILNFDEFNKIRDLLGKIVCTSGGFDPIHPGHTSCILDSKKYGDTLVVIVNGDDFLTNKKGKPFMDLATRTYIVSCIKNVDYVIPFEIQDDQTVIKALKSVRPQVFTKGGDCLDKRTIPEWDICQEMDIQIITGVGKMKKWSSTNFLSEWGNFWKLRSSN